MLLQEHQPRGAEHRRAVLKTLSRRVERHRPLPHSRHGIKTTIVPRQHNEVALFAPTSLGRIG